MSVMRDRKSFDTDDLDMAALVLCHFDDESLTDRVALGPKPPRRCLCHDRRARRVRLVGARERAAAHQRDLDEREVVGRNAVAVDRGERLLPR